MSNFFYFIKRILIIIIVYLYSISLFLFQKNKNNEDLKKILIINNAKIGDLVCATPIFREIKKNMPDIHLAVLVTNKTEPILRNNPHIDEIISSPLNNNMSIQEILRLIRDIKNKNFDASINMIAETLGLIIPFFAFIERRISSFPSNSDWYRKLLIFATITDSIVFKKDYLSVKHYLDLLKPLGVESKNLKKEVFFTEESLSMANKFWETKGIKLEDTLVGFSLSAGNKIKEWPVERFTEVIRNIIDRFNYKIVIFSVDDKDEIIKKRIGESTNLLIVKNIHLSDLPAYLSRLNYFISVDTGILYIANALDIPVLDIVGPCNIFDQPPTYEKCEVVYVEGLSGWPYTSVLKTVTKLSDDQMESINGITVEMVMKGFNRLVNKYGNK